MQERVQDPSPTLLDAMKRIASVSFPIAGTLLSSLNVVITGLMLPHLAKTKQQKEDYLAATTLITALQTTTMLVSTSVLYSISIYSGNVYGQNKPTADKVKEISQTFKSGVYLSLISNIFPMASMWFSGSIFKNLLKQPETPSSLAAEYFSAYFYAVPGITAAMCLEQLLFGLDKQKIAFKVNFSTLIFSVLLSYLFTFGKFGFPKVGP